MRFRDLLRTRSTTPSTSHLKRHTNVPTGWVPPGGTIDIAGLEIRDGMVYAGRGLTSVNGYGTEPALIDPTLPVHWRNPDIAGHTMDYWPSYETITPQSRAAYLQWLAEGRSDPRVGLGYVFLFFYGLERRVLFEAQMNSADPDVAAAVGEVERLLHIYGRHGSFGHYATDFLEFVQAGRIVNADLSPEDISTDHAVWELPLGLRVAIARRAAVGEPLPADWALTWLRVDPMAYLRTPAERCAEEFDALFAARYRERFGDGFVLQPTSDRIELEYRPASAGFGGRVEATLGELPDVTSSESHKSRLREVANACTDALDSYSRYVGRHPDGRGAPEAISLLPEPLLRSHGGPAVESLDAWATAALGGESLTTVEFDELVSHWSPADTGEKLGKAQVVALASLLGKLGYGMEPDVRFGAPKPKSGDSAVLFRLPPDSPSAPSPGYTDAALLVRLSGLLAAADGTVSEDERRLLANHLEESVGLESAERARVEASLVWVGTTGQQFTGLRKKIESLDGHGRETLGHFLIGVAATDGNISPAEITTLTKLYRLLGLEESSVYSSIHALEAGEDAPVTVRVADPDRGGHQIPPQSSVGVRIDPARLSARRAETAKVAALLSSVFAEEEEPDRPVVASAPADPGQDEPADIVLGLDAPHSALVAAVVAQASWSRAELDELVAEHGLPMVEGAIDRVNDAAFELCGETLLEGDDPWEVNSYALKEIA